MLFRSRERMVEGIEGMASDGARSGDGRDDRPSCSSSLADKPQGHPDETIPKAILVACPSGDSSQNQSPIVGSGPWESLANPEARTDAGTPLLRGLATEDWEACLALDQGALGGLWTGEQWQRELAEAGRPGVGMWEGGTLLALATGWLIGDELHITAVAVDPEHRRRGLGRCVLGALLDLARSGGARHATLEVAAPNTAARGLYGSAGVKEEIGRSHV